MTAQKGSSRPCDPKPGYKQVWKKDGWLNFLFIYHCFPETGGGDRGLMKEGRKGGRQARKRGGGGIYWSSTQNVNKALAKDLSLVVSALTPRRLERNALVIHGLE